jgi:hypothetical protein
MIELVNATFASGWFYKPAIYQQGYTAIVSGLNAYESTVNPYIPSSAKAFQTKWKFTSGPDIEYFYVSVPVSTHRILDMAVSETIPGWIVGSGVATAGTVYTMPIPDTSTGTVPVDQTQVGTVLSQVGCDTIVVCGWRVVLLIGITPLEWASGNSVKIMN